MPMETPILFPQLVSPCCSLWLPCSGLRESSSYALLSGFPPFYHSEWPA